MALAQRSEARLGRLLDRAARGLAYAGGVVLLGMALVTVASIIGRALLGIGLGPIRGAFELVEVGCAIAVFAFLPLCQLRRGHVTVDVFVQPLPARGRAALAFVGDVLVALVAFVILWRFWIGLGEKLPYGSEELRGLVGFGAKPFFAETTYELEIPVWIPFAASLIGAAFFFLISVYTVWRSLNWTLEGHEAPP